MTRLSLLMLALVASSAALAKKPKGASQAAPPPVAAASITEVKVDFEAFTLSNGLRVIVHEDHKAPIVAVGVWYGVGSKDEPEGRTGFAHLFEHLMFNGSENYNQEYFEPLEDVGATQMNGTTWFDRTNYFQNVPTPALELALWMESDRMGHLLGAVDQAKLDEQRGVVQNEKRQGDNAPYGKVEYRVLEGLFPAGHPYRHSTIGSMDDLNAASLDDVKTWFRTYYGAANTVLVLAGDVTSAAAKPLVEKYFGDIDSGPPLNKLDRSVPHLDHAVLETMTDRVPQTRVLRVWAVPGRITQERALLDLAVAVLGDGKNSRLYETLVYNKQLASDVSASVEAHQLASQLAIDVTVAPGKSTAEVLANVDQIVAEFLAKGPTQEELNRARTKIGASLVRGLERIGGFTGKASLLAEGALYANDPAFFFDQRVRWMNAATPADVTRTAAQWMGNPYYQLTVDPFPETTTVASTADRSKLPTVAAVPELTFPAVQEATLANGIKLVVAERHAVPVVEMSMLFDAGYASDPRDRLGAASFVGAMLDEGTTTRSALALNAERESLGARIGVQTTLDSTGVSLSALVPNLGQSVSLYADIIRNPAFAEDELGRLRSRWLAQIEQEKAEPTSLALRLLPAEIYGTDHPYGVPLTGSGTPESINALTRDDLVKYHGTWLRPENATLLVVGDTTMEAIRPVLDKAFGDWKGAGAPAPEKKVDTVPAPQKARVVLIDKPGAEQSLILAAHLAPPTGAPDNLAITTMNDALGGQFTARINMNLRESKHWAYGAYSFLMDAAGPRPFVVYAPVQTDKTAESIAELQRELKEVNAKRPLTQSELDRVVKNAVRSLPGSYETAVAVLGSLQASVEYGRPWDYPATLPAKLQALTVADVRAAAKSVVHPEHLVWVIVGDVSKIEKGVRALNLGPVEVRN
jgi:zinc protease